MLSPRALLTVASLALLLACNPGSSDDTTTTASSTVTTGEPEPTTSLPGTGTSAFTTTEPTTVTTTGDPTTSEPVTTSTTGGPATTTGEDSTTGETTTGEPVARNYFPGYYILARTDNFAKILAYPQLDNYVGVHQRYFWSDWETTPKDYAPGLEQLDKDIAAVKQQGKKLLVFLNYEKSDGTHCVPPDLLMKNSEFCSGDFCGELPNGGAALPIYWNEAVAGRMRAWLEAMADHLENHPDRDLIAGITLPETATGDYDLPALMATGYTPDKYLASVQGTLTGLVDAAPSLIVFQYINGGFKPSPGEYFVKLADWALEQPGIGFGIPDLVPKNPNPTNADMVLRSAKYQGRLPMNPDIQAPDYGLDRTDSIDDTLTLALAPAPEGMLAGYVSIAFNAGPGPNAFTLDEFSAEIPNRPTNQVAPTW